MSKKEKVVTENLAIPNEILQLAIGILDSSDKAEEWFCTPNPALNGSPPIKRLNTVDGKNEVIEVLYRIQYGEFT